MLQVSSGPKYTTMKLISGYSIIFGCEVDIRYDNEHITHIRFNGDTKNSKFIPAKAGSILDLSTSSISTDIQRKIKNSIIPSHIYNSDIGKILYGD